MKNKQTNKRWKLGKKMSAHEYQNAKIEINSHNGYFDIYLKEIMYIESLKIGCRFHLYNASPVDSSYGLAYYSALLPSNYFGRYCDGFIMNMKHVTDFIPGEFWRAVMADNKKITVSNDSRTEFKEHYYRTW